MDPIHNIDLEKLYIAVIKIGRFHYKGVAELLGVSPKQSEGRWYFERRRIVPDEQDWRCILFKFVNLYINQQLDVDQQEMIEIIRNVFRNANAGRDDIAISQLYSVTQSRAHPERQPKKRKYNKSSTYSSFSNSSNIENGSDLSQNSNLDEFFEFGA